MKKNVNVILIFALLLVAAVAISGCAQYGQQEGQQVPQTGQEVQPVAPAEAAETQPPQPPASPPQQQTQPAPQTGAEPAVHIVNITVAGFAPTIVVVKAGDKVTWVNTDEVPHWPASAAHPTHTVYPGSGIDKCGIAEQAAIFDACRELAQGESFTFMFKEKGTWSYHDHLETTTKGRIVVE